MRTTIGVLLVAAVALGACAEQEQVAGQNKPASKSYDAPQDAFVAPGWKPGDEKSWEEHLRQRAQSGQNEYSRAGAGS